jgi:ABC-type transport system substrate-binding protein
LSFAGPDRPLKHVWARLALRLAIDRKGFSDAEFGGLGTLEGNWIPHDWPGAIQRDTPPYDPAKAKQLLADAGVPNGFEISQITPLPPYTSFAERISGYLRAVGINVKVNTLERAAFYDALTPGPNRMKGLVMQLSGAPGDAASRIRENAMCKGAFSSVCVPEIDAMMTKFDASTNADERKKISDEVQAQILDQYLIIPIQRQAFINCLGPKVANKTEEVEGAIPQYNYLGPYEDIQVKE